MTAASGGPARATGPLDRLAELGLALPHVATPAGSYLPTARVGDLVFTAGQLPFVDGRLPATGKVGAEVSPEDAKEYARQAGLNVLAAVHAAVGLDSVQRVVKLVGFVASADGFTGQPGVINGASDLMAEVFGEAGRHARSAVGVAELPLGSPVEVEAIVQVG
jgi:enamine deaminase RidA (YjgF/YER057c/UK114 family)